MRRSRAMRFAMLLAFVPQIAIAGAGFWSSSGPSGGVVYDVEINPATPTTLYASTRGGIFKSIDGGLSWARAQNGIVGSAGYNFRIVLDRDAPDTLYTFDASGRLYRTTDGAANWALTGYVLPTGVQAQDFADVPGSTTNLFLATSDFSGSATATGGLLRSTNAGASFAPAGTGLPAGRNFAAVAVDPTTPAVVLAGVDDFEHPSAGAQPAIYRSSDGGATWTSAFASPDPDFTPGVPAISFGPGLRVYASGEFATLLRSDDDGASWSNIGTNAQRVLARDEPGDPLGQGDDEVAGGDDRGREEEVRDGEGDAALAVAELGEGAVDEVAGVAERGDERVRQAQVGGEVPLIISVHPLGDGWPVLKWLPAQPIPRPQLVSCGKEQFTSSLLEIRAWQAGKRAMHGRHRAIPCFGILCLPATDE